MTESITLLHVEDEPEFAELASEFLKREDERFEIRLATDADEGEDLLETHDIDCIISDHDMPGRSGLEFLESVRETHPDLPFILFTGKGSEEVASKAITAGVTDYLQKEGGTDQYTILANRIKNAVELRRAEARAERTRTQLEAISANSADAIVIIDADSRIHFANQAVEEYFGYMPAELEGEPLTTLMPERLRDRHPDALNRYLETGEKTLSWSNVEFPGVHKDGSELQLSISFGEFHQNGEQRFIGIMRDISEQKRREQQLREKQAELRTYELAVENSIDLVAACDTEYTLLFANEQYRQYHGIDSSDLTDASLPELLGDEWEHPVKAHVDRALAGDTVRYEMERSSADGDVRALDIRYDPLREDDGTIVGAVATMRDITSAQEQKRKRESIIERVTDAIVEVDVNWRFTLVNEQAESLYDMREEELLGRDFWEVFPEAEGTRFEETYRQVMKTREPASFVEYFGRLDGWFDINVYPNDDGGLSFYFVDVTDQQERQAQLRAEQAFTEATLDGLQDVFFVLNEDWDFRRWNERLVEVSGYPESEIADLEPMAFFVEEHQERIINALHQVVETGSATVQADVRTKGGERIPYEFRGTRVDDPEGEGTVIAGIGRDITDRRQRERELARQKALLAAQQESVLDGMLVVDEHREIVSYNGRFVELWSVPAEIVAEGNEAEALEYATDQLADPDEFFETLEYLYDHKEETSRDEIDLDDGRVFDRYTTPLIGEDNTYFGRLWTFRDITNRVEREAELERQKERLDGFASVVSHDLRNPLNVAQGRLELAQEDCDSPHHEAIGEAHGRMEALITDMLTLAREGRTVTNLEDVDVASVCEDAWEHVDTKQATLTIESLPSIRADRSRLQQALENLFRNAVEHGGDDVQVAVGALQNGISIADDGPGISEDHRDDIFTVGFSTDESGTGFGLNIVRQVVKAHGWELRVTDGPAGGAQFEITGIDFVEA